MENFNFYSPTFFAFSFFRTLSSHYRYFNEFSLALETGMRIGEIIGFKWADIDFSNRTIYVNRTLIYIKSDDKNSPNPNHKESLLPCNRRYAHI